MGDWEFVLPGGVGAIPKQLHLSDGSSGQSQSFGEGLGLSTIISGQLFC